MSGAKCVVDVNVLALYERGHKGGVVGLLARVEAKVLEELYAVGVGALALEQLVKPLPEGAIQYFESGLPFGLPRWLHTVSFARPRRGAT